MITYMVGLAMSLDASLHKQGSQGDQAAVGGFESLSQYSSPSGTFSQPFSDFPELGSYRRKQIESSQAAMQDQERYEDSHLGGYRRIYPGPDSEKYAPFFKHNSSLFQETAASKAREECARYLACIFLCTGGLGANPEVKLLPSRARGNHILEKGEIEQKVLTGSLRVQAHTCMPSLECMMCVYARICT